MSVASWAQAGRAVDDRPMRRGVTGRREGGDVARAGSHVASGSDSHPRVVCAGRGRRGREHNDPAGRGALERSAARRTWNDEGNEVRRSTASK